VRVAVVLCLLLIAAPVAAQESPAGEENPLAELKADLTRVLADANLPFAAEQDRAITLMMEDRLNASETLFGGLMDFRGGPTSGQEAERLQSAIGWLRTEFLTHVDDYLTPEQQTVWTGYRSTATASPTTGSIETTAATRGPKSSSAAAPARGTAPRRDCSRTTR
jgi:hypothetical protein